MKQSITLGKVTKFMGLGFLGTFKDLFTGKLEKEDFRTQTCTYIKEIKSKMNITYF